MSARAAARIAWVAVALSVALGAVTVALEASLPSELEGLEEALFGALFVLLLATFAVVGALIVSRHPGNPVGWLFSALPVMGAGSEAFSAYAQYGLLESSGDLPGEEAAAWIQAWSSETGAVLLVLLLLLFPSGRFLSPRWRRAGLAAVVLALVWATAVAFDPGPLPNVERVSNPLGIEAAGVLEPVAELASVAFLPLLMVSAVSVFVRYRRAHAEERQQIKWLAAAAALAALMVLALTALGLTVDTDHGAAEVITSMLAFAVPAPFPVAAGIAILRHRLYDIDVVINRTLVYGALTALLALIYVASVLLLQLALRPLTEESNLAIAGSTLAVAALFRPARTHIQDAVDRRFYRRKYDAARTLEAFSARLRDEVDLDTLGTDLRAVVNDTMQPAHVSLWLRGGER